MEKSLYLMDDKNSFFSNEWSDYFQEQFYVSLKVEILLKNIGLIIILIILSIIQILSYPYNFITF